MGGPTHNPLGETERNWTLSPEGHFWKIKKIYVKNVKKIKSPQLHCVQLPLGETDFSYMPLQMLKLVNIFV